MRLLAVAAGAAMLVSAMPASVATAAKDDGACRVYNMDKQIGRNTLQRAVWDADPGDQLLLYGTCVGTTVVRKNLTITGAEASSMPLPKGPVSSTGKPRIRSGSWRPALVIDPSVDEFSIVGPLPVIGGIVVGDARDWQGPAKPVSPAWRSAQPSGIASKASPRLRKCHVRNDDTGAQFRRSQHAVSLASAGDHLSLRGTCWGTTVIQQDLTLTGWRVAISSKVFGQEAERADSGPPLLGAVVVDDDVDDVVLRRMRVKNGFVIRDLAP
jgi:hypothetical protein